MLRADRQFGVVLTHERQEVGERPVSTPRAIAEVCREAKRRPDGRYELLVVGTRRFRVVDVLADREPYLVRGRASTTRSATPSALIGSSRR